MKHSSLCLIYQQVLSYSMNREFSNGYRAIHPLNKWSKDTKSIMSDLEWWRDDCRTTKLHFKITLLLSSTLSFSKICIHHHNPLYYKLSCGRQARSVNCFCNRKLLLLIPFTHLSTAFIRLCFTTLATELILWEYRFSWVRFFWFFLGHTLFYLDFPENFILCLLQHS